MTKYTDRDRRLHLTQRINYRFVSSWLLLAVGAMAQLPSAVSFDAASVKFNRSGDPAMTFQTPPGRLEVRNMDLRTIIKNAYGIREDERLEGGSAWLGSDRFDISATCGGQQPRTVVMGMLQSLLGNRFRLQAHHETKESPALLLELSKSGLRAPELKPGMIRRNPNPDAQTIIVLGPPSALALRLAPIFRRIVVDRTGLTGRFDLTLEGPPHGDTDTEDDFLWVAGALEKQLGLTLKQGKAEIDVLVVDHIERPSAN